MTATPQSPRVDGHAHCFVRGLTLAEGRRYAPDYDAPIAAYLTMLDTHGLTHGVLVQPSFLGTDNGYLLAALRTAPRRLRGIAMLEPDASADTIAEMAAAGVVGVRLNLLGKDDPDLMAEPWRGHLRRIADAGWQVEIQCEAARLPRLLPPLLAAGVTIVVDHFGRPDARLGVDDPGFHSLLGAAVFPQVWVKLSGAYRLGANGENLARRAAQDLRDAFGPDRLVWGSDWPHTQFERVAQTGAALAALETWLPNPTLHARVLGANAIRLFGFPAQPASAACQAGHWPIKAAKAS